MAGPAFDRGTGLRSCTLTTVSGATSKADGSAGLLGSADVAVVGGGIVGLAHAWHAVRSGRSVILLERDEYAVGSSIRNFGHIGTTVQAGAVLDVARRARELWLTLAHDAGFPVVQAGTVVVARHETEQAVLEEFVAARPEDARLLAPDAARSRLGLRIPGLLAAVHLPADLRIEPPAAIPAVTAHLQRLGVTIHTRTAVQRVEPGLVRTTRGDVRAEQIILAVGYDVDRFFPDLADSIGLLRCRLRMLEAATPDDAVVAPALLTGLSLLRYDGFSEQPSAARVRDRIAAESPELLEHVVNLMCTQRPDGSLILGDTHHYGVTEPPFEDEASDELLLEQFRRLLGVQHLTVRRRWRGVYASSPVTPFLVADPLPGVRVVSVTSGIGMTTALGLAEGALDGSIGPIPAADGSAPAGDRSARPTAAARPVDVARPADPAHAPDLLPAS